ncbi:DUF5696 domain-containing protein [Paenibacillus eucommiae]|uniref:Uncharacterized protein n=1 Tax=Paenibacillus eucommiae TaxID=1355755 RepID=A0ABS4IZX5_9BACL|nr:DUF5696 domain-containing protein [Paenibacillus eucommiae]MBP1993111.1 hypothetical protein [Paenibacillus eucommiae]
MLFVITIIIIIVISFQLKGKSPVIEKMDIPPVKNNALTLHDGSVWPQEGMTADPAGFLPALENQRYTLRMHPGTTQFIITDKQNGYEWRSNPTESQLQAETVKGTLLANLQSPFILEISQILSNGNKELMNSMDDRVGKEIVSNKNGIQITYVIPEKKVRIAIQYELTDQGLKVAVPAGGIEENGDYGVLSLNMLPFFGATEAGTDGYFLVPDGPGGLITFKANRPMIGEGYNQKIFGEETTTSAQPSERAEDTTSERASEAVQYPVFGAKRGDHAFVAIVGEGRFETRIKALSPGMKSNLYSIYPTFTYREEYLRKLSRVAPPVKVIQQQRLELDWSIEYRFLTGSDADYVGMANSYREYMLEQQLLGKPLEPVQHVPLDLSLIGGNSRKAYNREQYVAVTTFPEAANIVQELTEGGVKNQRIIFYGWQDGGSHNTTKHFPIEKKLGGEPEAKSFIEAAHGYGYKVIFEDNFVEVDPKSSLGAKGNGIYGMDETVFITKDGGFILRPLKTLEHAYTVIEKLRKLGVDGIQYLHVGERLVRDYNPNQPSYRRDTAYYYNALLAYTRDRLGMSGVNKGFDYTLAGVNAITSIPLETSGSFMVDEAVPFYPIAIHGYVSYSAKPGNLRELPARDFLRSIEYGAVPAYMLSYDSARELKDTANAYMYSSKFDSWKEEVIAEYLQFDRLSPIFHLRITGHEKMGPGVYETMYEDGTRVTVDYNSNSFEVHRKEGGQANE